MHLASGVEERAPWPVVVVSSTNPFTIGAHKNYREVALSMVVSLHRSPGRVFAQSQSWHDAVLPSMLITCKCLFEERHTRHRSSRNVYMRHPFVITLGCFLWALPNRAQVNMQTAHVSPTLYFKSQA